jgi:hypothetical protein
MSSLPLNPFQYIVLLQARLATLSKENTYLTKTLMNTRTDLQLANKLAEDLISTNTDSAIALLSKKIRNQIQQRNLPPAHPFLSVSIEWIEGFEEFLLQFPHGTLVQPLPYFRAESMVTIRKFSSNEELEQLFPTRFRRNFAGGGWAILEAPMEIKWSKTTNKLSAKFTYTSYLASGKVYLSKLICFRVACIY